MIKIGETKFSSKKELKGYLELLLDGYPDGGLMLGHDAYMVREVIRAFLEDYVKPYKGVKFIKVVITEDTKEKLVHVVANDNTDIFFNFYLL